MATLERTRDDHPRLWSRLRKGTAGQDATQRGSSVTLSSIHLSLTTVITSGFGYLYWVAAAWFFNTDTVGYVNTLVAAMLLITTVGSMGIGLGLAYVLPHAQERWSSVVNTSLTAVVGFAATLSFALILVEAMLRQPLGGLMHTPLFLAVFIVGTSLWTVNFVLDQVFTVERATALVLWRNAISSVTRLLMLPAVLLLGVAGEATGLFGAWGLSALISMAVVIPMFARSNPHDRRLAWRVSPRVVREVIPISLSNHVLQTIYIAPGLVLPLIVSGLLSYKMTAYFYYPWMIATIIFTIPTSTSTSLFAQGAARQELSQAVVNRVLGMTLAAVVPLALVVAGGHHLILSLFDRHHGAHFAATSGGLLVGLAATSIPMSLCNIYISAQRIRRRFKRAFGVAIAVATLSLGSVCVVITHSGLTGAGVAIFLSYLAVGVFCFVDLYVWKQRPAPIATAAEVAPSPSYGEMDVAGFAVTGAAATVTAPAPARRALPLPRRRSSAGSRTWNVPAAGSVGLVAVALLVWLLALPAIHPGNMTDVGLVSVFPAQVYIALGIMLVSFCLVLRRQQLSEPLLLLHVVVMIFMLYGVTALVEQEPRFAVAWRHIGFTDVIARTGHSNGAIDAYFNWPSFFILSAFITKVTGLSSLLGLVAWAPAFFNLLYLGPLLMVLNGATRNKRIVWLAAWFFFLTNWIGQDYFAPQAFNFFLNLVILGLLLRYFPARPAIDGATQASARGTHFSGGLVGRVRRLLARAEERLEAVPAVQTRAQRVAYMAVIAILFGVSVASHQLTPFATLASVCALVIFNRCSARGLPIAMAAALATWISFMTVPYLSGHINELTKGGLASAIHANVANRLRGSAGHDFVVHIRLVMALVLWATAAGSIVWLWRRHTLDIRYVLLLVATFPLVVLQDYGGEMILRVYLFALPSVAFFLASLFLARRAREPSWATTVAVAAFSAMLLGGFVYARYGNERMDYMTPKDVAAVRHLYAMAPTGSLLVGLTANMPWKYTDFELYRYAAVTSDLPAKQEDQVLQAQNVDDVVALMNSKGAGVPSYLIITRSQRAEAEMFDGISFSKLGVLEDKLAASPKLRKVFDNGDAQIFVQAPRPQVAVTTTLSPPRG